MAEQSASRAALLALRRDRQVIQEGHRFLDEKRVAFAHELLRQSREHEQRQAAFLRRTEEARRALAAAVGRHGLEGLQVYPVTPFRQTELERDEVLFLGRRLIAGARMTTVTPEPDAPAGQRSAEGERCSAAFRALADEAAALAAAVANLLRLMDEYRRTERRVRALENIVLPEMKQDERRFEAALEEVDQEEVMRSRLFAVEK